MMVTTSTKGRPDNQSLSGSRPLSRKPKPAGLSEHSASPDGPDHKQGKPLPNYLKATISSRPDPVRHLKKGIDDHQKLLRRRSFDRPPSSLSSPSTSSPRDKPLTGGNKNTIRGGGMVKSPPSAPKDSDGTKKSGPRTSRLSLHSRKERSSSNVSSDKEISRESSPPTPPAHEEEHEIVKIETDVQMSDDREGPKSEDKEMQAEESDQTDASPLLVHSLDATKEEKEEVIDDDKTVEEIEEAKAPKDNLDGNGEGEELVNTKVGEERSDEVAIDVKETPTLKDSAEEEKAGEKEQKQESESRSGVKDATSETKAAVTETPEGTKREVVQGKKEARSDYNDVIEKTASKLLENRKNKVKALVGAFETVIDYETAASK
ncbi:PREDICTED: phosphatase and actin regulator 4B-like [Tarenaya hassleriana]|uniref:phosphatase and actin regulator 4B-like n=1 Tax=Tarenaya hassleriana TaxID=28532 RepID=UPI00053C0F42|nr:PREDICTED: phosphatase and actin regulator 4B-like [Tarenaya hassleriana]XP_010525554.1 PREDICTED: phosphatase and actin regulator 4B-like [Tarenaya hassleriana]